MSQTNVSNAAGGLITLGVTCAFGAVILTTAAVVGVTYAVGKGIGKAADAAGKYMEEQERRRQEELKNFLLKTNCDLTDEIIAEINKLGDETERARLTAELKNFSGRVQANINAGRLEAIDDPSFREIRRKALSAKISEEFRNESINSLLKEFEGIKRGLEGKILPNYQSGWNDLRSEMQSIEGLSTRQKEGVLTNFMNKARDFAERAAFAANISLAGIVEERYVIPAREIPQRNDDGEKEEISKLWSDIKGFSRKTAVWNEFMTKEESRRLNNFTKEASVCESKQRLGLILDSIKVLYSQMNKRAKEKNERKIETDINKKDIRDILPWLKKVRGSESIILRMEELLKAEDVPNGKFEPVYHKAKEYIAQKLEQTVDEALAQKTREALNEMGYSVIEDESENIRLYDSPYEGYKVRVKVDKGGTLSTRLVRAAGSEEEKNAATEYQKQKDIEIGRIWCKDLDALHERMKSEGVEFEVAFRKEPEEMPLDVIVAADAKSAGGRKKTARGVQTKESSVK